MLISIKVAAAERWRGGEAGDGDEERARGEVGDVLELVVRLSRLRNTSCPPPAGDEALRRRQAGLRAAGTLRERVRQALIFATVA